MSFTCIFLNAHKCGFSAAIDASRASGARVTIPYKGWLISFLLGLTVAVFDADNVEGAGDPVGRGLESLAGSLGVYVNRSLGTLR